MTEVQLAEKLCNITRQIMDNTFEIPDDIWFLCISCLTPLDLTSFCVTCNHFNKLPNDKKYEKQINNYWKVQCEKLWFAIKPKYKCVDKEYHNLFRSMVNVAMKNPFIFCNNYMRISNDHTNYNELKKLLRIKAYNMEMTIDDIDTDYKNLGPMLSCIITDDMIEMFKICLCNVSDEDTKMKYFDFGESEGTGVWGGIIEHHANKIAKYILTPGNFPNIDLSGSSVDMVDDTLLTCSCYHKCDEIVSLLLKHPNMTKECINTTDNCQFSPLHCVCIASANDNGSKEKALKIAQLLLNDDRMTHLNSKDNSGSTPLMRAVDEKHAEMVKLLLERSDIDCDETILDFVQESGTSVEVKNLIKEHVCAHQSTSKKK